MLKVEAYNFAIPLESVVLMNFLYFLPVYTFKISLTFATGFLVLLSITFTLKYFPDLYVVDSFEGLNVTDLGPVDVFLAKTVCALSFKFRSDAVTF